MRRLRRTTGALVVTIGAVLALSGMIAAAPALASPHASASARVHCGGFNGQLTWSPFPGGVHVWGVLWTTCHGSDSYLFVSEPGNGTYMIHPSTDARVRRFSVGINYEPGNSVFSAITGTPSVTVCNTYGGGWHCGTPSG